MSANIVFAAILVLSLMGTVVSPEKFILPAYFVLGFPFILAVNIGFTIFWMVLRRWWFLLSLIVLLLASTEIKDTFPLNLGNNDQSVSDKKPITIMSYNTFVSCKLKKHKKNNPNMVVQHVLDVDPDILCLQEFVVSKKSEYITEEDYLRILSKYKYHHIEYQLEESTKLVGIATFSKFPIVNKHKIEFDSYANLAIYTDININGKIVRLVNNHLESNRLTEKDKDMPMLLKDKLNAENLTLTTRHFSRKLGIAYKVRAHQSDIVAEIIENSPHSVICCGDFNDVPASYAYTRVKGRLTDAFSESGTGFGFTFHDRFYRFRIDYLMYDPKAFSLVDFQLGNSKYSDHYSVSCSLIVN